MKILIADDMEGISGVVDWRHVGDDPGEYARFRHIMTGDVNAAVRGAYKAGADEVVVSDGHGSGRNVLVEELDRRAKLNSGSPSPFSMVSGIDQDVDALMYVGYHARKGTLNAILCHTWTGSVRNVYVNGLHVGEIGLNGLVAGHFNVPLIMISSDLAGCNEALDLVPGLETVAVKKATGRFAAEVLQIEEAQARIEAAAEKAVLRFKNGDHGAPLKTTYPVKMRVEFDSADLADGAAQLPGCTRVDGRSIEFTAPDMPSAHRSFRAAATLSR